MKFSIIFCHFKTGKVSAYSVAQLLKHSINHEIEILISDNNCGDGSIKYLEPFKDSIKVINYPKDRLQSHGCGYDLLMNHVSNEWVISIESDSFPTESNWLNYFEEIINRDYDCASSLLSLSGGCYGHPAGMLFRRSVWQEAMTYCKSIEYNYYPNCARKEGFDCHLMVHKSVADGFVNSPEDYVELANSYVGKSASYFEERRQYYLPVVNAFHNGMGSNQESIRTYGQRNPDTEPKFVLLDNRQKLIKRIGEEPGQWLFYYQMATNKKVAVVPTEIKWLPNRENQQQEYTRMENGFTHIWAGSSYLDMEGTAMNDVYEFKKNQIEELYNSLPEHQKING